MKKSTEIIEKDHKYFASAGRIPYFSLVIDEAHGSRLVDVDGKEYIDLLSSASALNVGHSHKKVVSAIENQSKKLIQYTAAYMYHEPLAKLAKKLVEITPGDFDKKVLFGLSGSDANDGMVKFARAFTGRPYIISFTGAYHGSTFGANSMSFISLNMRRKFGPLMNGFYSIPFPDKYRGMYGSSTPNTVDEYLQPLREMFEHYVSPEEVAAINIETIQGDGGLLEPVDGYFKELRKICDEFGILLMVDDVQQGLGRTGKWSSIEHYGIDADIIAFGKSLAGGLPLSAIVGKKEIMESLDAPAHLFTTGANPVACEAALATIEVIEEENLLEETLRKEKIVKDRLKKLQQTYDFIGDVRGIGLSIGIDIVKDKKTKEKDAEGALKIANKVFDLGAVIIAIAGSVLRFQPPLVITDEELTDALDMLEEAFGAYQNKELEHYNTEGQGW